MNGQTSQPTTEPAEHAHVRELLRAWGSFLTAVELDGAVSSRTRISAGAAAAALHKVTEDVLRITRDCRELRRSGEELQQELQQLERQVASLSRLVDDWQHAGARG